jgi:hypothetical protein
VRPASVAHTGLPPRNRLSVPVCYTKKISQKQLLANSKLFQSKR